MSLSFRRKPKYILLALFGVYSCSSSDDKKTTTQDAPPPNTCKAMVTLGTWPGEGSVQTWVYGCFEGYESPQGLKSYLALKCIDGKETKAPGFEFVALDSPTCPTEEATSICEGATFKIVAYKQDPNHFNIENFRKYCESKSGELNVL